MSVRDNEKVLIINDALTGEILDVLPLKVYSSESIYSCINDIIDYTLNNEHGFMVKVGYNN